MQLPFFSPRLPMTIIGLLLSMGLAMALAVTPSLAQTRMLETSFGPVEIPTNPTRIVATHTIAALPLVEFGVIPVGSVGFPEQQTALHIWEQVEDIPVVATRAERNFEAIAALEPDLIFETDTATDDVLERLRQIAPVVVLGLSGEDRADWRNRARQVADAVGALDRWQEYEDQLEAQQAHIADQYGDVLAENPLVAWATWTPGAPNIYTSQSTLGPLLLPTGAVFAPSAEALPYDGSEPAISLEQIGPVFEDARLVFYSTDHRGVPIDAVNDTRELEVYQRVPAVAEGREFPIGTVYTISYTNAFYLLDGFEAALEQFTAE